MIRPSARSLAILALVMWVCSLGLVGFTTSGRDETWLGYEILYSGWLGFADNTYAWFANPLLLWAVRAILKGRRAGYSSCGALLLALDTLRTVQITVDEGGHTAPIYGFGWGAVLWGLAMAVVVVAAGTRALESSKVEGKADRAGWLRPLGLIFGVALVAAAVSVNVHQRQIGNDDERLLLNQIAYKVAPVCGAIYASVLQPMQSLNGPLELRFHSDEDQGRWDNPEGLLEWGIPVVRYADRDYALLRSTEGPILTSRPATGPAAAILDVAGQTHEGGGMSLHVSLTDAATSRQLFEQSWTQAIPQTPWCPRMVDPPGPQDQPRKVMMQALSIAPSAAVSGLSFDRYWAVMGKKPKWQILSRGSGERDQQQGTNCPANVGWAEKTTSALQLPFDPFRINEAIYYSHDKFIVSFRCESDRVYFYESWGGEDGNPGSELVEARSITDFQLLWAAKFPLELIGDNVSNSKIQIRSISPSDSGVKIDFLDARSGNSVLVNLPDVR